MSAQLPFFGEQQIMTFVLVLCRTGAVLALAPMFSGRTVPMSIKGPAAVLLAVVLTPLAAGKLPDSTSALVGLAAKEVVVGLAIGLACGAVISAWQFAGAILDLSIGFSYGGVLDPVTGSTSQLMTQIYGLLAIAIFTAAGGEQYVLSALASSYHAVPVDSFPPAADFEAFAVFVAVQIFSVGLGVAAPVLIALLVTDVAFGLLAKAAPQTQILVVEFPVKIAVGLICVAASIPFMAPVFLDSLERLLRSAIGG